MSTRNAGVRPPTREMVRFRRNRFVARFPRGYRYSPAHYWLVSDDGSSANEGSETWRVGLTHFATRMLGDIVEFDVETESGSSVEPGVVLGWIEGMKAVTDLFCVGRGVLVGPNPRALENPELVCTDPYGEGWLYSFVGVPDEGILDVESYLELLGETIDQMEEKPWQSPEMGA